MSPNELRGGDQWYNVRPQSLCFRAAVVVHRLGVAGSHDVATVCGITPAKAYEVLWYCAQHAHRYHVQRIAPGRFAPVITRIVELPERCDDVGKMCVFVPRGTRTNIRHQE